MSHGLQDIMQSCFNGRPEERDCKFCAAHSVKGGPCCFGRSHEYNDPSPTGCQTCVHEKGCAAVCHAAPIQEPRRLIMGRNGSTPTPVPVTPQPVAQPQVKTAVAPMPQAAPVMPLGMSNQMSFGSGINLLPLKGSQ
jgi:hypothetical protein